MSQELALRPLLEEDRWRLRDWRNSERVRAVSIDDAQIETDGHSRWFDRVLEQRRDEIFVAQWQGRPVGVVQLEEYDRDGAISSWGCHLGETDVPPGLGATLPLLALAHGFETLGLRRMHAKVLGHNNTMRSIHRRLALPQEGVLRHHLRRADGTEVDVYLYGVLASEWPELREKAVAMFPSSLSEVVRTALTTPVSDTFTL